MGERRKEDENIWDRRRWACQQAWEFIPTSSWALANPKASHSQPRSRGRSIPSFAKPTGRTWSLPFPLLQSRGKSEIGSQNVPPLFPAPAPRAGDMGTVRGPVGCHQRGHHPQSCQESDGQRLKGTAQDASITHSRVREPGPTAGRAVGQGPPPPQAPLWQRGAAGSASHPARYAAAARRMETSGSGPQTSGAPS